MKLTDSSAAKVGASAVTAIASSTPSTLQFKCYAPTQVQSAQLGSLNLEKNGTATLQLSGTGATHSGAIRINEGALDIVNSVTLNGVISGVGSLTKTNNLSTLTLGAINTYSGGTPYSEGNINFNSSNAFGTGTFVRSVGGQLSSGGDVTLANNFVLTAGTLSFRTFTSNTIEISGGISGAGSINKAGIGFLNLFGTLTYTGSTNIQSGFIRAKKTVGASMATAQFQSGGLGISVSFDVAPPSGTTAFRFFQGVTNQTYTAITLLGVPAGTTATYTSATSTLAVTVP